MKRYFVFTATIIMMLFLVLCYSGCGGKSNALENGTADFSSSMAQSSTAVSNEAADNGYGEDAVYENASDTNTERKLTKTVNLYLETKNFSETVSQIDPLLEKYGGYISHSYMENEENQEGGYSPSYADYTLKIPQEKLNAFLDEVASLGNIRTMDTSTEDLTSPYYDTAARLKSLTQQEERLLELLEQAENIEQIITIEDKLSSVRSEIEYLNSMMANLENQVAYSTVYLSIRQVVEYTEPKIFSLPCGTIYRTAFSCFFGKHADCFCEASGGDNFPLPLFDYYRHCSFDCVAQHPCFQKEKREKPRKTAGFYFRS